MILHLFSQNSLLYLVPVLEQLLDDIVAEDVRHQLEGVGLDLAEQLLLLIAVGRFQLLLDEPRAMLITTKLYNVVVDVLRELEPADTEMENLP